MTIFVNKYSTNNLVRGIWYHKEVKKNVLRNENIYVHHKANIQLVQTEISLLKYVFFNI